MANDKPAVTQDAQAVKADLSTLGKIEQQLNAASDRIVKLLENADASGQLSTHDAALVQVLQQRLNTFTSTLSTELKMPGRPDEEPHPETCARKLSSVEADRRLRVAQQALAGRLRRPRRDDRAARAASAAVGCAP